ncbi:MAG: hypothetical protein VX475_21360 [Myxococcota bacterium]|nr:hypothetical protein [Myxococcota bacterium]
MNEAALRHLPADRATRDVIGATALEAMLSPASRAGAQLARDLPWFTPAQHDAWKAHVGWLIEVDAWAREEDDLERCRQDLAEVPLLETPLRRLRAGESLRDADFFTLKRFFYHATRLLEQSRTLHERAYPLQTWFDWLESTSQRIHPEKTRSPRFHLSDALSAPLAEARKQYRALGRARRQANLAIEDALRDDYPGIHIGLDGVARLDPGDHARAREDERLLQAGDRWRLVTPVDDANELDTLEQEIAAHEATVRAKLTLEIADDAARMEEIASALAAFDLGLATSRLREEMGGSWPEWSASTDCILEDGGDPRMRDAQRVSIQTGETPTLITGPNMGGKSSLIELVGLCQWCLQRGLPAPARRFSAPPVEAIVYTGSDEPDSAHVSEGLSSFGREIRRMVDARCTPSPVLWLLDELGRGTHPQEGAKLASEIIEALSARGDRILASTHFPELARMQGVALWRIEGLRDREALDALIGKIATSEELEQALRDAMSYQPERITQAEDAIPRDATLIAKLLGW